MKNKLISKLFLLFTICAFVLFGGIFFENSLNVNKIEKVFADGTYSVTVNVDSDKGEVFASAVNESGNAVVFESGNTYAGGTMITLNAVANPGFEFAYYNVNGETKVYDICASFVINEATTIDVVFAAKKYQLEIIVCDSVLKQIAGSEVNAKITYQNNDFINTPNQKFIRVGDTIKSIQANNVQTNKYNFLGIFVKGKNDTKAPLQLGSSGLTVDKEFISNYFVDGKITIYIQYVQLCKLKIVVPEECKSDSNYMLLIKSGENSFNEVAQIASSYEYGTCFSIMAKSQKYFDFKTFVGANDDEQYVDGFAVLNFVMTGDRTIALKYQPKSVDIVLYTSNVDAGSVTLDSGSVKVGDTLVFNYELGATRKLKSILVNDKSIEEFVDILNNVSTAGNDVAVKTGEGLFSVYVDKDIFDYFSVHNTLIVKTQTEANIGLILLIVFYVILILIFGTGFVVFGMLYNKTNKGVYEINKRQSNAVKQKQEEFIKEKAISDQAVKIEYELLRKQKENFNANIDEPQKSEQPEKPDAKVKQTVRKKKSTSSVASKKKKVSEKKTESKSKPAAKKSDITSFAVKKENVKKKSISKKETLAIKAAEKIVKGSTARNKSITSTKKAAPDKTVTKKSATKKNAAKKPATGTKTSAKTAKKAAAKEGK